ncbi:MAG: sulfite exporter TauE/SafE family protein [Verrucomicrobia bacterium]|nr:sulfite exporter TauE/SafE family protein [Verrucomicrobiota bacterium]NDC00070.1 sulfite exporter TauE/SafE family protein [Verrucomicrobiota bacterium]
MPRPSATTKRGLAGSLTAQPARTAAIKREKKKELRFSIEKRGKGIRAPLASLRKGRIPLANPAQIGELSFSVSSPSLLYAAIGLLAGITAGCFGIGGGTIIVPALILLCGVPYHVAVGTSLALIIPISLAGAATSWRLNTVDWRITAACAVTGMAGAVLGSLWIQKIPEVVARRGFAVFLLYAAWRLWMK